LPLTGAYRLPAFHSLSLDQPPLPAADRTWGYKQGLELISIIKSWSQEGHLANENINKAAMCII